MTPAFASELLKAEKERWTALIKAHNISGN
jgi:hypothetical protein